MMVRRPGTGNETLDQAGRRGGPEANLPLVHVVDDDQSVRCSLERLVRALGYDVRTFATGRSFLNAVAAERPGCVLLDLRLPDMDGLAAQEQLAGRAPGVTVILVSGYGDIPMSVRAMKAGAADFLTKPVDPEHLASTLAEAIERSRLWQVRERECADAGRRYVSLTRRQQQVMGLVIEGRLNKQIADRLNISEKTVKAHRHEVMMKMGVRSVAELVRLAQSVSSMPAAAGTGSPGASPQTPTPVRQ